MLWPVIPFMLQSVFFSSVLWGGEKIFNFDKVWKTIAEIIKSLYNVDMYKNIFWIILARHRPDAPLGFNLKNSELTDTQINFLFDENFSCQAFYPVILQLRKTTRHVIAEKSKRCTDMQTPKKKDQNWKNNVWCLLCTEDCTFFWSGQNAKSQLGEVTSTYTTHPYPNTYLVHQGKGTAYPR